MKATILAISLDTEGQEDLVLAVPQLVQAVRASMPPPNGASRERLIQAQLPPPAPAAPAEVGKTGTLPGVTIRPPEAPAPPPDNVTLFDHCQKCGRPKKTTKSRVCQSCATKAARARARHNVEA